MRSKKQFSEGKPTFVIFVALLLVSAIVPTQAQARKFKVLHTFDGKDGWGPVGALFRDAAGNLYGTTAGGGKGVCGGYTCGTAFKLDGMGRQVWLHSFNGKSGMGPQAGLLRDKTGNLYGTTMLGGDLGCKELPLGCGTVFKLDMAGRETVLYKFKGKPDGWAADSPVAMDDEGNLYGTTENGGSFEFGPFLRWTRADRRACCTALRVGRTAAIPVV
jgi:uncharacterized repeat protein (TIGR03803 family)